MKNTTLVLAVCFSLVAVAQADNTVLSSTMWFHGTLTGGAGGSGIGTLAMINEAGSTYGDGISGFDVYAKNGAPAVYDKAGAGSQDYENGAVVGHDAYDTAGGWGTFYDPDCADWYNYQLRLTSDHWYLEYNSQVGNDGVLTGAAATPMSGAMDWVDMYASEDDAGHYYAGMGTGETPGFATNNTYTGAHTGAGYWDMDWSWGSEAIPLEYPGFQVEIFPSSGGDVYVSLTPRIPSPGAAVLAAIGLGLVGLVRKR